MGQAHLIVALGQVFWVSLVLLQSLEVGCGSDFITVLTLFLLIHFRN